jgi:hypothetical protein
MVQRATGRAAVAAKRARLAGEPGGGCLSSLLLARFSEQVERGGGRGRGAPQLREGIIGERAIELSEAEPGGGIVRRLRGERFAVGQGSGGAVGGKERFDEQAPGFAIPRVQLDGPFERGVGRGGLAEAQ